jgi:hypothetical protein
MPQAVPPGAMRLNPAYEHDKLAIASLILGIVSLPAAIFSLFTLPIPITGIVLGIVSLKRKKSFAIAGIVLSVIGLVLSGIVLTWGYNKAKQEGKIGGFGKSGSAASVTSPCYSFALPGQYNKDTDIHKNDDCVTQIINSSSTDNLGVNSLSLSTPVPSSQIDAALQNLAGQYEGALNQVAPVTITAHDFINLDGVRAYRGKGTESYGNYKHFSYLITLAPKDYTSANGTKLKVFTISSDSATSAERVDEIAKSWKWQ